MNNKQKHHHGLMRAVLREPKRQPTPDFLMIQNESAVSDYLLSEAACQSSTLNITEYNRQQKQVDFKNALFLTNFYRGDTAGGVHWVVMCPHGATVWSCFHVDGTPTQSFLCTYYLCIYFNTLGWFCSLCV